MFEKTAFVLFSLFTASLALSAPSFPAEYHIVYDVIYDEGIVGPDRWEEQHSASLQSLSFPNVHVLWDFSYDTRFIDYQDFPGCQRTHDVSGLTSPLVMWDNVELVGEKECKDLNGELKTCQIWGASDVFGDDDGLQTQFWWWTIESQGAQPVLLDSVWTISVGGSVSTVSYAVKSWSKELDPAVWEVDESCLAGPPDFIETYTAMEDIWAPCQDAPESLCQYWHGFLHRSAEWNLFVRDSSYLDKEEGNWKTEWSRYDGDSKTGMSYIEPLECDYFGWEQELPSFADLWNPDFAFDGFGAATGCGIDFCTVWVTEDGSWKMWYDELYQLPVRREQANDQGEIVAVWDYALDPKEPSEEDFEIREECSA